MRTGGSEVAADEFRRHEQRRVAVDRLPLQRIVGITGPDTVGVIQHAEVDAPTARRARLDFETRMPVAQLVHEAIGRRGLPVAGASQQVAVLIPLQVADRILVEQRVDLSEHVREGIRVAEIDRMLVAPRQSIGRQDPVRMVPRDERVEAHHLGFHPQPEIHTQFAHAGHERMEALRVAVGVDDPVAQGARVVDASDHPPVVEHEPFGADGCCEFRKREEFGGIVVEVHRLPGVEHHRAGW